MRGLHIMLYQTIIETDSDLDVLDVDGDGDYTIGNDVVGELATMQTEWANSICPDGGHIMPGTRVYKNRKVIHAILDINAEDPLTLLESLLAFYDLDWEVWILQSLGKHLVVNIKDEPILDEEDNKQYEATIEKDIDETFIKFLNDVYTGDPPVTSRPTLPVKLHSYSGWESMTVG